MSKYHADWYGLYKKSWKGEVWDGSFTHPAKFSRRLIQRIYQHALAHGFLQRGDRVLDCFAGVALGGLDALLNDLHWTGVELETRFVVAGQENINLWMARYAEWFQTGSVRILQGDSRRLIEVVAGAADGVISSPPYANSINAHQSSGDFEARMERMKRAGIDTNQAINVGGANGGYRNNLNYGDTPGQLGAMPPGDISAIISSPPFENTEGSHSGEKYKDPERVAAELAEKYANGTFKGHPPSEEAILRSLLKANEQRYGDTPGNIGNEEGETFWTAARQIVEQVYLILKPGGVAIWVCKDFVRRGERVPFSDQWQRLCEACGFEPVERIRAWMIEERGNAIPLFDELDTSSTMTLLDGTTQESAGKVLSQDEVVFNDGRRLGEANVERKSFWRKIAEKRGAPRIDWEDVIIVRKPLICQ